jgi:hypothetical protein
LGFVVSARRWFGVEERMIELILLAVVGVGSLFAGFIKHVNAKREVEETLNERWRERQRAIERLKERDEP